MALPKPGDKFKLGEAANPIDRYSIKEAVNTGLRAGLLSAQANILEKSFLRLIPGSGILKERAEFRRSEMLDRRGRDPTTGRKLSSEEIKERDARRKYYTATGETLGNIADDVGVIADIMAGGDASTLRDEKKKIREAAEKEKAEQEKEEKKSKSFFGKVFGFGKKTPVADKEAEKEKEREDEADADREQKENQGFFTKLFGGMKKEGGEGGGLMALLGSLSGLLAPITGAISSFLPILAGGIGGLVTTIIGALGTATAALLPVLGALLPVIIPLALAGAAGYAISKFIDSKTKEKERAARVRESTGMQKQDLRDKLTGEEIYEVSQFDKAYGTTRKAYGTAKELGITQEEIDQGMTQSGASISRASAIMETRGGEKTGLAAAGMNDPALAGALASAGDLRVGRDIGEGGQGDYRVGKEFDKPVQDLLQQATDSGKDMTDLIPMLKKLETAMAMYTIRFKRDIPNVEDVAVAQGLADEFNQVMALAETTQAVFAAQKALPEGKKIMAKLAEKYMPFEKAITASSGVTKGRARVYEGGILDSTKLILPEAGTTTINNPYGPASTIDKSRSYGANTNTNLGATPILPKYEGGAAGDINSLMDTNANLKAPAGGGGSASPSVTNVSQTATSNTMVPNNPRRVGDDIPNNMSPALAI